MYSHQRCPLLLLLCFWSISAWSQYFQWRIDPDAQKIHQFVAVTDSTSGISHWQPISETPKSSDKPWLLVIHALWADKPGRQAAMFDRLAIKYPGHQVLMLVWETKGRRYQKQWAQAYVQGEVLGEALKLWLPPAIPFDILVHSAGHQVLRGVLSKVPVQARAVVFAAPDLDAQDFNALTQQLPGATMRLLVHRKDKALLISQWLHKAPRIGRQWEGLVPDQVMVEVHKGTLGGRDLLAHLYVWDTGTIL